MSASAELVRVEQQESLEPIDKSVVIRQVTAIQEMMRAVMKKDEHYGVIPGCGDKPTLLKAGAEKLLFTFRLASDPQVEERDLGNRHREYTVRCTLTSLVTGVKVGTGVGSASTLESKWRYRSEATGKPVPSAYWDSRDAALLGGSDFSARKVAGKWLIFHRVEHDNPPDYYNTCLKMAKKRALVDATLTALAASDIFTQDVEEMKELLNFEEDQSPPEREQPQQTAPVESEPWDKYQAKIEEKQPTLPIPASPRGKVGEKVGKGVIERITVKNGTKRNGEPYTQISAMIGENWYSTFDTGLFPGEPKAYEGCECAFTFDFDKSGKYRNLASIAIMEREAGQEG